MPLLSAIRLGKSYGPVDIFSELSFSIPEKARIGMVGANGVGKTTLLRILLGLEDASSGKVHAARGLRLGYLPQEAQLESSHTMWDECLTVFADLVARQAELSRLEHLMSDPDQAEAALQIYGVRQAEFEHLGGYTYPTRMRQTLTGLGFSPIDFERPVHQLSGGQRTRALLARLLLSSPDLLLLDEPTNHLDIEAVEWLEDTLADYDGAVLIVSHDRYFLDRVVTKIWEMTPALEEYNGNYSAYLLQREEHYQRQLEEFQSQTEFIEKEEEYIRRNIAGQNTRQAQGRRKRLERLLEEARLTPPRVSRKLKLNLKPVGRSGDLVLRTMNLQVGYADEGRPLFATPDLTLVRGECAAILGPNGAGKTTFLKTLLEKIPPYGGEVSLGASLTIGYFAQAHENLRPQNTLMDEIMRVSSGMIPAEVRDYLAKFLFTGDDVFKFVGVLSGGERGRLALACLALSGANLLLLDEPTNHLDLPSQEILQGVLGDYPGTILLVSHDRYLIDALATQIWEVRPENGLLKVFEGTYSEYKVARQAGMQASVQPKVIEKQRPTQNSRSNPALAAEKKKKARLQELENQITDLEFQQAAIGSQLENPPADAGTVMRLGQEYQQIQHLLDQVMDEWADLAES